MLTKVFGRNRAGLGVRVTGTSRIGKSVFLFYVARVLNLRGIPIVITLGDKYYDHEYKGLTKDEASKKLDDSETVHLIDPSPLHKTKEHYALAVFCVSPMTSNIDYYHLKNLYTIYMPLWTKEELESCQRHTGRPSDISYFEKWGGVHLDKFREEQMDKNLQDILQSTHIPKLVFEVIKENSGYLPPMLQDCEWLFHRHPYVIEENRPYRSCKLSLPSNVILKCFQDKIDSGIKEIPQENYHGSNTPWKK